MSDARQAEQIKAVVRRWPSERQFAAAEAMERLSSDADFKLLTDMIEQAREQTVERMVVGPTLMQADYTRQLGLLAGLDIVRKIPREIQEAAATTREQLEKRASRSGVAGGE